MTRPFIGAMRHRLVLEEPVDVPDGTGGTERRYEARGTVTAQLRLSGPPDRRRYVVLMRPRPGLGLGMRLRHRGRILQILAIERADPLSHFLRVSCEALRG